MASVDQHGVVKRFRTSRAALDRAVILSLSLMLVIWMAMIANVAIPSITQEFGSSYRDAEWVNTIYLVYAATLILWAKSVTSMGGGWLFRLWVVLFGIDPCWWARRHRSLCWSRCTVQGWARRSSARARCRSSRPPFAARTGIAFGVGRRQKSAALSAKAAG